MGNEVSTCCQGRAATKVATRENGDPGLRGFRGQGNTATAVYPAQRPPRDDRVGIGAYFMRCPNDATKVEVRSMLSGGPSDASGRIQPGDRLVKVNGHAVESMAGLVDQLLGPEGSKVVCTFHKRGEADKPFDVELVRGTRGSSSGSARSAATDGGGAGGPGSSPPGGASPYYREG